MREGDPLSLADLAEHDPRARPWSPGSRGRYCCPLPECQGKKVDAAHRTLTVYPEGGWICARCKAKGKLVDAWEDRTAAPRRPRRNNVLDSMRGVPTTTPPAPSEPGPYDFAAELRGVVPIAGTAAAGYLESRAIPADLASRAGVRFAPAFGSTVWVEKGGERRTMDGAPAVVFPLRDVAGRVVGMQGRVPGQGGFWKDGPNKRTLKAGGGELGAFATLGAFEATAVVLTEAPIDALTLHLCGMPAVATVGTACPAWLVEASSFRLVFLAHDDDDAGDAAAETIAKDLCAFGSRVVRLRPPPGHKDWNAALQGIGAEALSASIARAIGPFMPVPVDPFEDPD